MPDANTDGHFSIKNVSARSELPRLEQTMLWEHVLKVPRSWLIAHDTDPLPLTVVQQYERLAARRLKGEPMAYIIGSREFMGHSFMVSPAVLIPRPETEFLVEQALAQIKGLPEARVLDMGTGSGAVAISIALARPDATVIATDISADALAVAQQNAHNLCAKVEFLQGSWYDAVKGQAAFDIIVSNPPYIAEQDPHLIQGDLRFEPISALSAAQNGLDDIRQIISGAHPYLSEAGSIWLEHGWDQAVMVRNLFARANFNQPTSISDLAGIPRITGAYI